MKIHIAYDLKDQAWGGGNQFLKALRHELIKKGVYAERAEDADAVVFNSFPFGEEYRFRQMYQLKKKRVLLIHRVDGPISKIRARDVEVDRMLYDFNSMAADGTVFQSQWSREQNLALGMKDSAHSATIVNAPDPKVFNTANKAPYAASGKVRLVATSWSSNPLKGFDIYAHLDEHLDFDRYDMTFIGRSPVAFENIATPGALDSDALAQQLKQHDIFVTASRNDPCSNSLIEALHCGLPAVALNDGGHPGIIGRGGETFTGENDVLAAIDKVASAYSDYQGAIALPDIAEVSEQYYGFVEGIHRNVVDGSYESRRMGVMQLYQLLLRTYAWKLKALIG